MSGTYSHMNDALVSHYTNKGITIEVDPPGRGAPDILGTTSSGRIFVGEIKSSVEADGSAGSWWSHWTKPERDLQVNYSSAPPTAPKPVKGWCAVIDGQLHDYCNKQGVTEGDLVVEDGSRHTQSVETALAFLRSEGRVKDWTGSTAGSISFWTISFA